MTRSEAEKQVMILDLPEVVITGMLEIIRDKSKEFDDEMCNVCLGSGEGNHSGSSCTECNGSGEIIEFITDRDYDMMEAA